NPDLLRKRNKFHFLGKAAWSVKNVAGAIDVIKATKNEELMVLGGHRLNLKMGFRFTLSSRIQFYGMVGLPGETQADLDDTVRLMTEIKKKYRRLRIVFGVSSFVPKAQTPFQWNGRDKDCGKKLEFLRKRLAKIGISIRPESHNWSDIQTYLSRADRRVTPLLLELAEGSAQLGAWKKAFRNQDPSLPDSDFYIFRQIPQDEFLPWSHLLDAPKKAILSRHKQLADSML
ncbi:MAG: hypothetical protein K2X81_23465, partial [Candidatus Obscuribacterales bacterium]|nr:hypothetical protein [Candidatus Obscuribacterales bacterium]